LHPQVLNQKHKKMKEKILALLTEKFAGVRKDGFNQLAIALALQVDSCNLLVPLRRKQCKTGVK
jgi:hypothetical protein